MGCRWKRRGRHALFAVCAVARQKVVGASLAAESNWAALMGRYRKIDPRIWNDEKFRLLGDDGQLIFLFLLTHPSQTALGAMRATMEGLAIEKRWTVKRFQGPFEKILQCGMAVYDEDVACIWLPKFVRYNEPESPNVVSGWLKALNFIPECALRRRAIVQAGHAVRSLEDKRGAFKEAFAKAFPEEYAEAFMQGLQQASVKVLGKEPRQGSGKTLGNREQRAENRDIPEISQEGNLATGPKSATGLRS